MLNEICGIEGLIRQQPHLPQGVGGEIRSSVEVYVNRELVPPCRPRIPLVPLHHSPAVEWLFSSLYRMKIASLLLDLMNTINLLEIKSFALY